MTLKWFTEVKNNYYMDGYCRGIHYCTLLKHKFDFTQHIYYFKKKTQIYASTTL